MLSFVASLTYISMTDSITIVIYYVIKHCYSFIANSPVSTSAIDCLGTLIFEMTHYVLSGILNVRFNIPLDT